MHWNPREWCRLKTLGLIIFLSAAGASWADDPPANDKQKQLLELAETKGIKAHAQAFVSAFDQGDAKAIANTFYQDAQITLNGMVLAKGKEKIQEAYTAYFKENPGARISVTLESLEFPAPNVAIEKGVSTILGQATTPTIDVYTAFHVQKEGKWLTVSTDLVQARLKDTDWKKDLGFLAGKWETKTKGPQATVEAQWVAGGQFLQRKFHVEKEGKTQTAGVQMIGFDPILHAVTSWEFDSNGSYTRSYWTRDGVNWAIESQGVTAEGAQLQSHSVMTVYGKNDFRWQSTDRRVNGQVVGETKSVRVQRVGTANNSAPTK